MTARHPRSAARGASAMLFAIGAALAATGLAGCGTTNPFGPPLGDYQAAPRDLIGVAGISDHHVVHFSGRHGQVGKADRERLDAFIAGVGANRPESLRVALHGRANPAQLRGIVDILVSDGVDPRHIARADRSFGPPAPAGTVVVAVDRAIAVQPDCPGWLGHVSAPEDNFTNPNFGCSNAANFAAMIGDPHHLRHGASTIYSDGEVGATSVADYRAGKVKELPKVDGTSNIAPSIK
jgi:pilus biogenesis lipoprotein CpaD